jgi:DNA polymerase III subunit gamma/tau
LVQTRPEPQEMTPAPAPEPVQEPEPGVSVSSLADIAALADKNRDLAFKVLLKRCVRPVRVQPGQIEVSLTGDAPRTLLNDLSSKLKAWTGRNWIVSLSREEGGATLAEEEERHRENVLTDARSDPAVAAILAKFPGAKVIDVRIPDAPEVPDTDDVMPDPGIEPADDDEI